MNFPTPVALTYLADLIGAEIKGNKNALAKGINEIHRVEKGDLVFVDHPKYYDTCIQSEASYIIINKEVPFPDTKALLIVDNPFEAYLKIIHHFRPFVPASSMISETAIIGEGSYIGPGSFVGAHVIIGKNCRIMPNVVILDHCIIGNNVIIQSGSVIGSDAFYYNTKKDREQWYRKMESCGQVILEDGVEIGAGCTLDRGVTAATVIGSGTKMDNMVHIGHDTTIGKNCLIAAQVGIAGAVNIEDGVTLWGQVGVSKTLTIGANAVILAQSGVPSDLEGGKVYWGTPTEYASVKRRELVWIKRIPELWDRIMK